jgi:TRAP-type uncharacterized transport system substrate-binding protein
MIDSKKTIFLSVALVVAVIYHYIISYYDADFNVFGGFRLRGVQYTFHSGEASQNYARIGELLQNNMENTDITIKNNPTHGSYENITNIASSNTPSIGLA